MESVSNAALNVTRNIMKLQRVAVEGCVTDIQTVRVSVAS